LQAFHEYHPCKANRMSLTLYQVLNETMKVDGSNKFKLLNMKKARLERQGLLPLQVNYDATLVNEAMEKLVAWNI
jgi:hypothetical protein